MAMLGAIPAIVWNGYGRLPLKAKIGVVILSIYILIAIIGPWLAPYDPSRMTLSRRRQVRRSIISSVPAPPARTCFRRCSSAPARPSCSDC